MKETCSNLKLEWNAGRKVKDGRLLRKRHLCIQVSLKNVFIISRIYKQLGEERETQRTEGNVPDRRFMQE